MKKTRRTGLTALSAVCGLTAAAAFGLAPTPSVAATVVVSPISMGSWTFVGRGAAGGYAPGTNPSGVGQMVSGPASPPLGTGSAELKTDNTVEAVDGEELRNTGFTGTRLDAITTLTYWTYDVSNNGSQFPYLTLTVSKPGGGTDYIAFEPPYQTAAYSGSPQGPEALNTWQEWNALIGQWWSQNGLGGCGPGSNSCTLAEYLVANPNAVITNEASGLGAIRFAVGYTSGATDVLEGYVDAFSFGTAAGTTTYDFEPGSAVPLPAALPLFGSGLGVVGGLLGWRKRRKRVAQAAA